MNVEYPTFNIERPIKKQNDREGTFLQIDSFSWLASWPVNRFPRAPVKQLTV